MLIKSFCFFKYMIYRIFWRCFYFFICTAQCFVYKLRRQIKVIYDFVFYNISNIFNTIPQMLERKFYNLIGQFNYLLVDKIVGKNIKPSKDLWLRCKACNAIQLLFPFCLQRVFSICTCKEEKKTLQLGISFSLLLHIVAH